MQLVTTLLWAAALAALSSAKNKSQRKQAFAAIISHGTRLDALENQTAAINSHGIRLDDNDERLGALENQTAAINSHGIRLDDHDSRLEALENPAPAGPWPGPACPNGFIKFANYGCYAYVKNPATWYEASAGCRAMDAYLAEPKTEAQFNYIESILQTSAWVGGSCLIRTGEWLWTSSGDSLATGFTNWNTDQPDNWHDEERCLEMYKGFDYRWNDRKCATSDHNGPIGYVCQYDFQL